MLPSTFSALVSKVTLEGLNLVDPGFSFFLRALYPKKLSFVMVEFLQARFKNIQAGFRHRESLFMALISGWHSRLRLLRSRQVANFLLIMFAVTLLLNGSKNYGLQKTGCGKRKRSHFGAILPGAASGHTAALRTAIIDGLVAARILNATLVVPILDQDSFWNDASDFSDIFDVDWFITSLTMDVKIIKKLPEKDGKVIWTPYTMRVPRKCTPRCYQSRVLPVLMKKHASNPEKGHRHGKCPLTPEEVGLLLRALGFGNDVHLYVASGEIYGGEETLSPLKALFPNFHSKETLATKEELAPFSSYSSRMAALDFIVCDGSDVFVTNNNGNMARMRYFGHKRTIRPNAKKLYSLFLNRTSMPWEIFSSRIRTFQRGFMGEPNEVRPGRGGFHEHPSACICGNSEVAAHSNHDIQTNLGNGNLKSNVSQSAGETIDNHSSYEDFDWIELDDGENTPIRRSTSSGMESEYDVFIRRGDQEPEDIISD
ncbi:GDP-fucose protein O-fucosyltransferase [Musa troglodytarum]|uniref:O-fucosyltransferase family protein n=1 Tax=Musa troglodytarum TaxID=320322 RepID=A0A9E7L717_9LILI|nr:GDP-fucose protein O-fucosyltransferase [Musa troglodytarum]